MVKYVNYGHSKYGIPMYVITMYRIDHGSYKVEVSVCDNRGTPVSDPVVWDVLPTWWDARKYVRKQYKEFYRYVNERR
jgi:hypothetical protein